MSQHWCCADFQRWCYQPGKRETGLGIVLVYGPRNKCRCLLEYRSPDRTPSEPVAEAGVALNFCPWCGNRLLDRYGSGHPPFA